MDREELLKSLESLNDEIAGVDRVDPETKAALAKVTADVRRVLDPADPATADDVESPSEGVRSYLLELEAEHPKMAEMLGRIADALANLGI